MTPSSVSLLLRCRTVFSVDRSTFAVVMGFASTSSTKLLFRQLRLGWCCEEEAVEVLHSLRNPRESLRNGYNFIKAIGSHVTTTMPESPSSSIAKQEEEEEARDDQPQPNT
ncbi:hypothetical protein DY000_02011169 [Brassica cretica]|uniref:Uncharacterized protein n=1 Tax=Brassica cretica TaxID=69181 RepID=A0ABQ7CWA9_BRACR|nr:hypothetical protein DY000_02011169 [Brassica cretica]